MNVQKVNTQNFIKKPDNTETEGTINGISSQMQTSFRFKFVKKAEYKYLSHLDIINLITRAIARAGFKIGYTNSFNPKPKITFSNPTPLGVESLAEYSDATLVGEISEEDFFKNVNAQLPLQSKIVEIKKIKNKIPNLMADISVILYNFKIKSFSKDKIDELCMKIKNPQDSGESSFSPKSLYKLEMKTSMQEYENINSIVYNCQKPDIDNFVIDNIFFLKVYGYAKIFKETENEIFKFNRFLEPFPNLLKNSDVEMENFYKEEMFIFQNECEGNNKKLKSPLEIIY